MSNTYGFDFLKSEHRLDDDEANPLPADHSSTSHFEVPDEDDDVDAETARRHHAAQFKSDLEKQFDIVTFLSKHRSAGFLPPSVIYKGTGIDLDVHTTVADYLRNNPKVKTEMDRDPENPAIYIETYAYQAKFPNIRDKSTMLAQINRMANGVPSKELMDSYASAPADIQALITAGDIIALSNSGSDEKDRILFPRGDDFFVELDGLISLPHQLGLPALTNGDDTPVADDANSMPPPSSRFLDITSVEIDVDPRTQVRRGEAIQVGGQWFRVSSAVKDGPLSEQPTKAQAPLSVVSLRDLSKDNEKLGYIRPFTTKLLPLDGALSANAQKNVLAAKAAREKLVKLAHGRSGGVAGQLLGSNAHASNPVTLASSLSGNASANMARNKRPITKISASVHQAMNGNGHGGSTALVTKEDLEKAASDPALALYCHARRHGCTRDVRELYLATRERVPKSDNELHALMVEQTLLEPGESLRQPRLGKLANLDNDGKPKKRRYYERKNQRMTNTHLEGTEIGAILALAAEETRQGRAVGDGGM